jgi:hypothetical protein
MASLALGYKQGIFRPANPNDEVGVTCDAGSSPYVCLGSPGTRVYVSRDPEVCSTIRFVCEEGFPFTMRRGVGASEYSSDRAAVTSPIPEFKQYTGMAGVVKACLTPAS